MNELEKIRTWNNLKGSINKIYDYNTRKTYYKALLARAIQEWGFNPENPTDDSVAPELDDWEKEFVEDINDFKMFGIDTRTEKRQNTHKEALARMKDFILHGGKFKDIPENIQVSNLYIEALVGIGDNICEEIDNFLIKE